MNCYVEENDEHDSLVLLGSKADVCNTEGLLIQPKSDIINNFLLSCNKRYINQRNK